MNNSLMKQADQEHQPEHMQDSSPVLHQLFANYGLTQRETEILALIATHGFTNRELAEYCYISEKTVKIHLANIMSKIGISSMRRLLALLLQQALLVSGMNEGKRVSSISIRS